MFIKKEDVYMYILKIKDKKKLITILKIFMLDHICENNQY